MQQVISTFLYYTRAIDPTMVTAMNSISAAQKIHGVNNLKKIINHFLDYAVTHPDAKIKYVASAMHL